MKNAFSQSNVKKIKKGEKIIEMGAIYCQTNESEGREWGWTFGYREYITIDFATLYSQGRTR